MTIEQRVKKLEQIISPDDEVTEIRFTICVPERIKNLAEFKVNKDAYIKNYPDEFKIIKVMPEV